MQARQSWLNETEMSLWLWIDFPTWRPFRLANQNCLVFARLKEVDFPRISLKNADWWERVVLGQYQIAFSQGLELFMSIHVFCVSCLTPWMLGTGGKCSQVQTDSFLNRVSSQRMLGVGLILQEFKSINLETKELADNWGYPGIILSTVHLWQAVYFLNKGKKP